MIKFELFVAEICSKTDRFTTTLGYRADAKKIKQHTARCKYLKITTQVVSSHLNENYKYTVSQKNDNDVAHYIFNAHSPILVIFCRDVAE